MAVLTEDELIKIRRHLHEIPELALQEKETHAYLLEVIQNFKQDYLTIKTPESLPTALLVLVKGKDPKRTIGYRTDIDALPVTEKTGLPFSSKTPGIMHACGHDIHMSVAIGLLSYFSEQQPKDNLLFSSNRLKKVKVVASRPMKRVFSKGNLNPMNFMAYTIIQPCQLGALAAEWVLCLQELPRSTSIFLVKAVTLPSLKTLMTRLLRQLV